MILRPLRFLALGAVLGTVVLLTAGAACAVDVGDLAPEFEGKEFFNCDDISLKELRGRLVLFELFSTG